MEKDMEKVSSTEEIMTKEAEKFLRENFTENGTGDSIFLGELIEYEIKDEKKYCVFLDASWCVDFRAESWEDKRYEPIFHRIKLIENLPVFPNASEMIKPMRRMLAQALAAAFEGDLNSANTHINEAIELYNQIVIQNNSSIRISMTLFIWSICWTISFILILLSRNSYYEYNIVSNLYFYLVLGTINGACLSLLIKERIFSVTPNKYYFFVCSLKKIVSSIIGSCLILSIINITNIYPLILQYCSNSMHFVFFLGGIIGWSDYLIENTLSKWDKIIRKLINKIKVTDIIKQK